MTNWILTAGLVNLRNQINEWAPDRDHTSDGTIGDATHQAETSGHNPDDTSGVKAEWNGDPDSTPEVRAIDIDTNFRNGFSAQELVDHIVALRPSSVLRYVIYNRRIWEAGNGWTSRTYTGASPHTEHIHFSGSYTQASDNNTTYDYRLDELDMTPAQLDTILNAIRQPYTNTSTKPGLSETEVGHDTLSQQVPDGTVDGAPQTAYYVAFENVAKLLTSIDGKLDQLLAK